MTESNYRKLERLNRTFPLVCSYETTFFQNTSGRLKYGGRLYEIKEDFLQNRCSQKFSDIHRKTPMLDFLFNKVAAIQACNFIKKKIPRQVLSCEYCEIFKNSFFYRTSLVAASEIYCFTFGSSRCSENKPSLKTLFFIIFVRCGSEPITLI